MIGIFGGTFDPIHNGHVQVIENLLKIIHFDKLIVIPNGHPPHKDKGIDPKVKLELVNIALAHIDNIQIDERGNMFVGDILNNSIQKFIPIQN